MGEWMVTVGDCREVMAGMDADSVDAIVCDPPYGLEFMGKDWDAPWKSSGTVETVYEGQDKSHPFRDGAPRVRYGTGDMPAYQAWFETVAVEALRVLKPGGHLLAFGGTRTFHRMTVAIEDAGFEVRDCLSWLYGSGFPKSLNVAKSIEGKLTTGSAQKNGFHRLAGEETGGGSIGMYDTVEEQGFRKRQPTQHGARTLDATTEEARRWEGWGTALKPAWEPIVMARKPLCGTVAANVLAHGTGGLNIDGSRIGTDDTRSMTGKSALGVMNDDGWKPKDVMGGSASGRWPANVLLDEGAAAALDQQSGDRAPGARPGNTQNAPKFKGVFSPYEGKMDEPRQVLDSGGGASRFFYVAKASRRDRNEGLETPSTHPTVKPTALMRHLVKLVTPPGGLVLDPFTGSGSTGKAAVLEGFRFHGIEQDAEYAEIARARIAWAEQQVDAEQPTLM